MTDHKYFLKPKSNQYLSVLMSVYKGEIVENLNDCFKSIWTYQSFKPSQIVLVLDGPLTSELESCIKYWCDTLGDKLTLVPLKENVGLGSALASGLKACKGEFIARMDTDDISMPSRFEQQIKFLINNVHIDVVGTFISEINGDGETTRGLVRYPEQHDDMRDLFKKRDPLPHVTAMFRRSYFEKAGPYKHDLKMAEDTQLWLEGFKAGCVFATIPIIGVQVRVTKEFLSRRADLKKTYQLLCFRLFVLNRQLGFRFNADLYAIAYAAISISPSFLKKLAYKYLR